MRGMLAFCLVFAASLPSFGSDTAAVLTAGGDILLVERREGEQ